MDMPTANQDVLTHKEGLAGRLRLNRPRALHSLNRQMVRDMANALIEWRDDPDVRIILIDHTEGRGFCAGGDVVDISQNVDGHEAAARAFFFDEYRLNHLEYTYPKPGIAFMDGVTMGGGVGIACPCRYRVATERTVLAMPETTIGIFPDVGIVAPFDQRARHVAHHLPVKAVQRLGAVGTEAAGEAFLVGQDVGLDFGHLVHFIIA